MRALVKQVISFGIVGVIATLIDFAFLYLGHSLWGWNYLLAAALSFTLATLFNYWASMRYVFLGSDPEDGRWELLVFVGLSLCGLVLNQVLLYLCIQMQSWSVYGSKVLVTGLVTLFNFVSRKFFFDQVEKGAHP